MANKVLKAGISFFGRNILLAVLIVISLGLALFLGLPLGHFPTFVDWDTIITLSGLLLITAGVKESGFFYFLAYNIFRRINNERVLALLLVFISAVLSMFLTNDIALFIVAPLTLSLQEISDNDYTKMVVFEAMAVNVGSSLTPIGNPQNIFLWHQWGISFPGFVKELAPLVLLLMALLFIFSFFAFRPKKIAPNHGQHPPVNRKMFFFSSVLLFLFILAIEFEYEKYFLIITLLAFTVFYKKVFSKTDWVLILLFIFIFVDVRLVCQLNENLNIFGRLGFNNADILFLSGALLSQMISNLPAAVLLSHYSANFKIIAYGVNIGGNGLLIGSFANLIALNFIKKKSKYLVFHAYSVAFFTLTLIFSWYIFMQVYVP